MKENTQQTSVSPDPVYEMLRKNVREDFQSLTDWIVGESGGFSEYQIPASDGVMLRAVCSLPPGLKQAPVILQMSPYPKKETVLQAYAQEMTKRGFAYCYVYCRGTGGSGGEWEPNIHEREDGSAVVSWLAEQDWVDGIGYWGNSYSALVGWSMADLVQDKVGTMYLTNYGLDRFTSMYSRGMFRQDVMTSWTMENAGFEVDADYLDSAAYRPQLTVDEDLWGQVIPWYRDWITHTSRNEKYWQEGFWYNLKENAKKIRIPLFVGEGWFDHHLGSAMNTWELLSAECKAHSVLRVGAWNHFMEPCVEHIPEEHLGLNDCREAFLWFDRILRKKELPETRISCYQCGGDQWKTYGSYPLVSEKKIELPLSAEAGTVPGARRLASKACEGEVSYVYDPMRPVRTHGAEACLRSRADIGSLEQPACGYRQDVVSFVTDPLESPLDILGKVQVQLNVASDAEDTAFAAKLMVLHPDGRSYNIRSGVATLGYPERNDQDRVIYKAGTPAEVTIDFWDISWRFEKGSRIRLDISSSDFPQYSIHTNTPGIWAEQKETRVANQTIFTGGQNPSRLILPLD